MTDLNDSLDNLFAGDVAETPRGPVNAPADYAPKYIEPCRKCGGSGRFVGYSGRSLGPCYTCKGNGRATFKTSPQARAQNRASSAARKATDATEALTAFEAAHPVAWAWIKANAQKFDFATKMVESIVRFGDLTENQLAACEKMANRDAAQRAERAASAQNAPVVSSEGIDRLKAAFDKAIAYTAEKGLKLSPRITIGGTTISPAKATSANPGALYVKSADRTYLGKIAGGKFFASRECSADQQAEVLKFVADPAEAAKVYGQTTGTCCVCNATLTSEWKHRGIGPICAQKFGW